MLLNDKLYLANRSGKRYIIHQGGTGAGKTYTTLQFLLNYAIRHKGTIISVVAETLPHLKRGAMRDIKHIIDTEGWGDIFTETKTDHKFNIFKSVIEFFPADSASKLRGARRDILFINECNNIDYESFLQLDVRTRKRTFLDFNPVRRFWVHDRLMPSLQEKEYIFMQSTYLDNTCLTAEERANIERRRQNQNWWKVYGEGEIGTTEGLVFNNWTIMAPTVESGPIPITIGAPKALITKPSPQGEGRDGALPGTLLGYGIDFGFTHSPTAIVQVNEFNGELYVRELLYRHNMQNDEILAFAIANLDIRANAIADSSEPKTISYLNSKGWFGIKASIKGHDSVEFGINLLLDRKINVTSHSLNLIKELRQYMWDTNHAGEFIRRPVKEYDHAIDAMRYVYSYPKKKKLLFA